jgi:hypothetical protein
VLNSVRLDIDAWLAEAADLEANPEKAAALEEAERRKDLAAAEGRPRKRPKLEHGDEVVKEAKKKKVAPEKKPSFVCALCPDLSTDGLLRVVAKDGGSLGNGKSLMTHKICVSDMVRIC